MKQIKNGWENKTVISKKTDKLFYVDSAFKENERVLLSIIDDDEKRTLVELNDFNAEYSEFVNLSRYRA